MYLLIAFAAPLWLSWPLVTATLAFHKFNFIPLLLFILINLTIISNYVHFSYFITEWTIIHKVFLFTFFLFLFQGSWVFVLHLFCFAHLSSNLLHHHSVDFLLFETIRAFCIVICFEPNFFHNFWARATINSFTFNNSICLAAFLLLY